MRGNTMHIDPTKYTEAELIEQRIKFRLVKYFQVIGNTTKLIMIYNNTVSETQHLSEMQEIDDKITENTKILESIREDLKKDLDNPDCPFEINHIYILKNSPTGKDLYVTFDINLDSGKLCIDVNKFTVVDCK